MSCENKIGEKKKQRITKIEDVKRAKTKRVKKDENEK